MHNSCINYLKNFNKAIIDKFKQKSTHYLFLNDELENGPVLPRRIKLSIMKLQSFATKTHTFQLPISITNSNGNGPVFITSTNCCIYFRNFKNQRSVRELPIL